jgi:hypothetical protein
VRRSRDACTCMRGAVGPQLPHVVDAAVRAGFPPKLRSHTSAVRWLLQLSCAAVAVSAHVEGPRCVAGRLESGHAPHAHAAQYLPLHARVPPAPGAAGRCPAAADPAKRAPPRLSAARTHQVSAGRAHARRADVLRRRAPATARMHCRSMRALPRRPMCCGPSAPAHLTRTPPPVPCPAAPPPLVPTTIMHAQHSSSGDSNVSVCATAPMHARLRACVCVLVCTLRAVCELL